MISLPCASGRKGHYLEATNECASFLHCNGGELIVGTETNCAAGSLFNNERQQCDWPENVRC